MGQSASHGDEQPTERAHKGSEGTSAGDSAQNRAEGRITLVEQTGEFKHDFVRSLGADTRVELGPKITSKRTKDRRKHIKDSNQDHDPHGGAFGGNTIGVSVKADQDMGQ